MRQQTKATLHADYSLKPCQQILATARHFLEALHSRENAQDVVPDETNPAQWRGFASKLTRSREREALLI